MNKAIRKAAVIGSGIMGSGIAAHLANVGIPCLLLDIVPRQLTEEEAARGLTLEHPSVRNRLAASAIAKLAKTKPAPLYDPAFAERITPGNLDDHLSRLAEVDWIIEVVVENLEVKKGLLEKSKACGSRASSSAPILPASRSTQWRRPERSVQKAFYGNALLQPAKIHEAAGNHPRRANGSGACGLYEGILRKGARQRRRARQRYAELYRQPHRNLWTARDAEGNDRQRFYRGRGRCRHSTRRWDVRRALPSARWIWSVWTLSCMSRTTSMTT